MCNSKASDGCFLSWVSSIQLQSPTTVKHMSECCVMHAWCKFLILGDIFASDSACLVPLWEGSLYFSCPPTCVQLFHAASVCPWHICVWNISHFTSFLTHCFAFSESGSSLKDRSCPVSWVYHWRENEGVLLVSHQWFWHDSQGWLNAPQSQIEFLGMDWSGNHQDVISGFQYVACVQVLIEPSLRNAQEDSPMHWSRLEFWTLCLYVWHCGTSETNWFESWGVSSLDQVLSHSDSAWSDNFHDGSGFRWLLGLLQIFTMLPWMNNIHGIGCMNDQVRQVTRLILYVSEGICTKTHKGSSLTHAVMDQLSHVFPFSTICHILWCCHSCTPVPGSSDKQAVRQQSNHIHDIWHDRGSVQSLGSARSPQTYTFQSNDAGHRLFKSTYLEYSITHVSPFEQHCLDHYLW